MRLNSMAVLLAVAFSAGFAPLRADLIYSNFGPGDSYNAGGGWLIGHPDFRADTGHGFIAGSIFTLDQVDVAIALQSGTNQIELWLMSDASGEPGSVIESFSFTGAMGQDGAMNPPLMAISVLHPELQAGVQYWLIASAPVADTFAVWNMNNQAAKGPRAYREFGGPWSTNVNVDLGAFRIQGTAVPEPGTFLLLLTGVAVLVPMRLLLRSSGRKLE